MKPVISKLMTILALSAACFSFAPKPGGEGFEISLNGKVLLQRFGSNMDIVKTLQLNSAAPTDMLTITYHHCGRVGKNRTLTFKDGQNNLVRVIHFADEKNPLAAMKLPVKDIQGLQKGSAELKLFYSSSELPAGRMLASIQAGNATAGLSKK